MARVNRMDRLLTWWSLVLLLAVSQATLLVHAADIDHHLEAEDCLVCLLGSGHDDGVGADSPPQHSPLQALPAPATRWLPAPSFRILSQRSRAPPCDTLRV